MKSNKEEFFNLNFIGVGSPKAGSTWVAKQLKEHPEINFSQKKEIDFFNTSYSKHHFGNIPSNYKKGIKWYKKHFEEKKGIKGEFSTSYLTDEKAYLRIKETYPDTKIIITLRNPADVVYSCYKWMSNSIKSKMPDTFEEAVENKIFFDHGFHYKHVNKYIETFSKKNVHIIFFKDIKENPTAVIKEVYKFLNVNENFLPEGYSKNVNQSLNTRSKNIQNVANICLNVCKKIVPESIYADIVGSDKLYKMYEKLNTTRKKKNPLKKETRAKLNNIFKEDTKKLEKLLTTKLNYWYEK